MVSQVLSWTYWIVYSFSFMKLLLYSLGFSADFPAVWLGFSDDSIQIESIRISADRGGSSQFDVNRFESFHRNPFHAGGAPAHSCSQTAPSGTSSGTSSTRCPVGKGGE